MVNSPIPTDLAAECRKGAKIIEQFIKPAQGKGPDQLIPPHIISNAKGIAVLTVVKGGFLVSARAGSGLVIARLENGSWSAPSAIGTAGMGFGGQIGAELTDFVIILNTTSAVKAFSHGGNVTLGGNLSVAAGPIGRNAEAAGTVGNFAAIFSYSKTRGLFAGVSIEGSVIVERKDTNATFYHRKIGAKELLSGTVPPPPAAEELYRALNRYAGIPAPAASGSNMPASHTPHPHPQNSINPPPPQMVASASAAFNSIPQNNHGQAAPAAWAVSPPAPTGGMVGSTASKFEYGKPHIAAPPPLPAGRNSGETAVAMYDFAGERAGDLGFKKGDIISITQKTQSQNDWWSGRCHGMEGSFPANYVTLQ
ncbi:hypothetical protein DFS34DRAFT_639362 [Phlyctochytrium arcticum]|nr:hypothetical protein DFS34DRAFT_639362 [Phlyctochytrium arcticum]